MRYCLNIWCGCDRVVFGFTSVNAISVYHNTSFEIKSYLWKGVLNTTLYEIKFVSDLWHAGWFSPGSTVSSTKTDSHNISTEILLKVILNGHNENTCTWEIRKGNPITGTMKKVCTIHQQLWYELGYILLQGLWKKCALYISNCGMN